MKKTLFTLFVAVASLFHSTSQAGEPINAVMHEREFALSTYYVIESDRGVANNVIKQSLRLRTSYEYYDEYGVNLATGYLRVFSLGAFYTWAGVIDVYDHNGECIGLIEGATLTLLPSKFYIYDGNGDLAALAYMDGNCMSFTITDPVNELKILGTLNRVFVPEVADHWVIKINDTDSLDQRLLYTFCAFAIDNQGDFRKDS
jgi:hypothetical protein